MAFELTACATNVPTTVRTAVTRKETDPYCQVFVKAEPWRNVMVSPSAYPMRAPSTAHFGFPIAMYVTRPPKKVSSEITVALVSFVEMAAAVSVIELLITGRRLGAWVI